MKIKTRGNSQNTKRDFTERRERLVKKAKMDCTKNPNTDSSKNLIFDQEHTTIASIPVVNGLTKEVHLSNTVILSSVIKAI
ncbi:hypothetical protein [Bacillus sp. S14(2024)]|uniref:hypothetical protein n=1 Tax=Bacillus sp. S14(2024) TaxID=3162884 RepID=UPI003D232A09